MDFLLWITRRVLIMTLIFYPFWTILFEYFNRKDENARNKVRGSQLVLMEYQVTETINAMREQMGEPPIDHKPVLAGFTDRGWEVVRVQCRQMVLGAIRKLSWAREVES
jgi:hypothetical protein